MKINVTPSEYADFTVAFLFDKLLNPDEVVPNNEDFNKLADILEKKGVKPLLMKYYISMDSNMRVKYKRLKKSFDGEEGSMNTINIVKSGDTEKIEPEKKTKTSLIKKIAKMVMPKILKAGTSISTEELEMIVEGIIQEEFDG